MSGVQRWRLTDCWGEPAIEHEDAGGDYVDFADHTAALAAKDAEIERLGALLKRTEWRSSRMDSDGKYTWSCPICYAAKRFGHKDGCELYAALAPRADGGSKP